MSDLNTMFNNGMGSLASYTMGQQQAADRQKQDLAMQVQQQKMQFDAEAHPFDMQRKQADLAQMAAQLPGIQGQAQSLAAKGAVDHASMGAKLAETLSGAADKLGEDGMKSLKREGEVLLQASEIMKRYPPAMHKQVLQAFAGKYGNPNSPLVQAMLAAPDNELLPGIVEMGKGLAMASTKFVQERQLKKDENDSQERINAANNKRAEEVARMAAEARARAEQLRAQARQTGLTPERQIAALEMIPETERTPDDWNALTRLKELVYNKAAMGANAVPAAVLDQESPTERATRLAQPQGRPAPQAAATSDVAAMAQKQGLSYEPEKYHYAVIDGVLKRKPK